MPQNSHATCSALATLTSLDPRLPYCSHLSLPFPIFYPWHWQSCCSASHCALDVCNMDTTFYLIRDVFAWGWIGPTKKSRTLIDCGYSPSLPALGQRVSRKMPEWRQTPLCAACKPHAAHLLTFSISYSICFSNWKLPLWDFFECTILKMYKMLY